MPVSRFIAVFKSLLSDWRGSARLAADVQSRLRLSTDFALSRLVGILPKSQLNRTRQVRLCGDIRIRYRLNRGDLQSIREIWFEEAYRLPFEDPSGVLLDLGANIGMTSLWLAKRYPFTQVVAVEPDPNNAILACQNLELNGINAQLIEAAVGPKEGEARFEFSQFSNLGRLSEDGTLVPMISVDTIINEFAVRRFGLVKIDIEGGEQALFDGPREWLASADAIIIEFHPERVDYPRLTKLVGSQGFKYISASSVFPDNMDCFTRIRDR
jgi:FkbM family methyltransferase